MGAGQSAEDEAAAARAAAERLARKQQYALQRAAAFAAGAEGERIVAERVAELSAQGYVLLHDRTSPDGGNLDHVIVGPTGVWLVNAKNWSGAVSVDAEVLRQNGRARPKHLARAKMEAQAVAGVLTAAGLADVPVTPVLVFTGAAPASTSSAQGVVLVGVGDLVELIAGRERVMRSRQVDQLVAALAESFPPADDPTVRPVISEGLPTVPKGLDDPGRYLFIDPWRSRGGMRRLYVKTADATQLGWVDPATAAVNAEADDPRAKAALTVIAKQFADVDTDEPQAPSLLHRFVRWYLDVSSSRQYVVGVRWRRGSRDRLYVHLAKDGEDRQQLGHVDRVTGRCHPEAKEFHGVLVRAAELYPGR